MYENNAEKVCILTLLFVEKVCHSRGAASGDIFARYLAAHQRI